MASNVAKKFVNLSSPDEMMLRKVGQGGGKCIEDDGHYDDSYNDNNNNK